VGVPLYVVLGRRKIRRMERLRELIYRDVR
jgi:hypothetical protein